MVNEKKQLNLLELQDILYSLLKSFADFCEKNNLKYFLFAGTLLGAVRHNDFIPWDDDIDVSMRRPDYERFVELTKISPWQFYEVKQYTQPFIKMVDIRVVMEERLLKKSLKTQCAYIDIFPIDGLSESLKKNKKHFRLIRLYETMLVYSIVDKSKIKSRNLATQLIKKFLFSFFSVIGHTTFRNLFEKEAKKFSYEKSKFVSMSMWGYAKENISVKEHLEKRVAIKFRDREYWCQGDYIDCLKKRYGNYMIIPPEEKRQPAHGLYYWKEGKKIK